MKLTPEMVAKFAETWRVSLEEAPAVSEGLYELFRRLEAEHAAQAGNRPQQAANTRETMGKDAKRAVQYTAPPELDLGRLLHGGSAPEDKKKADRDDWDVPQADLPIDTDIDPTHRGRK
jgi:hypothetical protein